ncbi:MAG TPA: enoyl-CoA hydratase-related protein [Acidimicrobiales bacterium]
MTEPESESELLVSRDDPVATLWLNRPAKRNAITRAMWTALPGLLEELASAPEVRVLVVRGVGGVFSAGADIAEIRAAPDPGYAAVNYAAEEALVSFPKPTVAVVEGACVGGGCSLAVACDLRIADSSARFGITPARLGIVYPANALERVTHLVGPAAAKWLLFTGDLVDTDWALRTGFVDAVHTADELDAAVSELCAGLAERSLLTQQATKEMVAAVLRDGAVGDDLTQRWTKEAQTSPDGAEGMAAFLERRPPRFRWPTGE